MFSELGARGEISSVPGNLLGTGQLLHLTSSRADSMEMLEGLMGADHGSPESGQCPATAPCAGVTSLAGLHFSGQLFVKGHLVTLPRSASFTLAELLSSLAQP